MASVPASSISSSRRDQLASQPSTLSRESGRVARSSKNGERSGQLAPAKASGELGRAKVCTASEAPAGELGRSATRKLMSGNPNDQSNGPRLLVVGLRVGVRVGRGRSTAGGRKR